MTDPAADDAEAIKQLLDENLRLTAEVEMAWSAYGQAQLRITDLERQLVIGRAEAMAKDNTNMVQFQQQRSAALANSEE